MLGEGAHLETTNTIQNGFVIVARVLLLTRTQTIQTFYSSIRGAADII